MSKQEPKYQIEEDEITLKELILKIQEFSIEVYQNWKLVLLITIPFILFFLFKAITTPISYSAELTFMVNEDEGGGIGGAMAILSQFGFGGGASSGKYNLDKILELSKSRKIIENSLFEKYEINDQLDYLSNHLIRIYDFHKDWEDSEMGLQNFLFTHDSIPVFNLKENKALKSLQTLIIGGENTPGFYRTNVSEETGIMTLNAECLSPELAIFWLESLYTNLSKYYINKSIEKQEFTYNVVRERVDSIKSELEKTEYKLANFKDSNRGIYTKKAGILESRLMRNVQILTLMYGETIKNLEIADFSLKTKTPFIQLIDKPILPLSPKGKSKFKALIIGGLLGGFLAVSFILGRKIYRETMQ